MKWQGARALLAAFELAACSPAWALRPFDGTDAAVAAPGELELELGPMQLVRAGARRSITAPQVANWGLPNDREIVLEGQLRRLRNAAPEASRTRLEEGAVSLKQVHRRGNLQDEAGMSIASECGVLLPELHGESGTGARCALIFSHRLQPATLHLNLALSRTRIHSTERFFSLIAEGPTIGGVRPVMELEQDHQGETAMTRTVLVGLIWRAKEGLSFDAAVRTGHSEGVHLNELRTGLTWNVPW